MFIDHNIEAIDKNNKIPISGLFRVAVKDLIFDMLTIKSDDTSIVDRFWNPDFKDSTLEKWCEWTKHAGTYIDVGAHTGLFTIAGLKNNKKNHLITIEPLSINFYRIITNLRLNNFDNKRATLFNMAVSDENKIVKFSTSTEWSYLSKGGKISETGSDVQAIKLDSLQFSNNNFTLNGIKIDCEGEDLNVLIGAKQLINIYRPNIIIEVRRNNILKIINFLKEAGYKKIYDQNEMLGHKNDIHNFDENIISKDIFAEYKNDY